MWELLLLKIEKVLKENPFFNYYRCFEMYQSDIHIHEDLLRESF